MTSHNLPPDRQPDDPGDEQPQPEKTVSLSRALEAFDEAEKDWRSLRRRAGRRGFVVGCLSGAFAMFVAGFILAIQRGWI